MGPWPLFEGNALIVVPSLIQNISTYIIDSSAFPYAKHINIYYTRHDVTIDTCLEIVKSFSFLISKQTF
jgi:hypothetical protein